VLAWFSFVVVLALVAGVMIAIWKHPDSTPELPGCEAKAADRLVDLDPDQAHNATLIAAIAIRRGLPARAVSIALAAAYQESKIRNLGYGDRDSVGIFQQRPSQGWGTRREILDPQHAINAFYDALERVRGYESMRITVAAQRVQHSGFPEAYEVHAPDARALASALTGYSTGGAFSCVVLAPRGADTAAAVQRSLTGAYGALDVARTGSRQDVAVTLGPGTAANRTGWSVAAYLVAHADALKIRSVSFDHRIWRTGRPSEHGWTPSKTPSPTSPSSPSSSTRVTISLG
jgi:hypothetical protein